jgi:uncharacterized membrane protein
MNLKQIILSGIILLFLDSIYLSTFGNYFNKVVTAVQGKKIKFNLIGAIFCYIFLIGGINYFILDRHKSWREAMLLGLIIYGVYETTNYTILSNWTLGAVVLDTCWGGILFALTTLLTPTF